MEIPGFAVNGPPRTKKTSNLAIEIRPKDGRAPFHTVLPSKAFQKWFRLAMQQAPIIKAGLRCAGIELPIRGEVNVRALFYRDAERGDAVGYYQALGDWLQDQKVDDASGKLLRQGAGIIENDAQIRRWWGSELFVDRGNPRIEVYIEVLRERPVSAELFAEAEEF